MKTKIFALLLSVSMCFVFTACGEGSDSKEKTPAQVNPVGVNETVKATVAETEAQVEKEAERSVPVAEDNEQEAVEKTGKANIAKGENGTTAE